MLCHECVCYLFLPLRYNFCVSFLEGYGHLSNCEALSTHLPLVLPWRRSCLPQFRASCRN